MVGFVGVFSTVSESPNSSLKKFFMLHLFSLSSSPSSFLCSSWQMIQDEYMFHLLSRFGHRILSYPLYFCVLP
jgi:hypothetical protein